MTWCGFGNVFGGKGWFSYEVKVKVRFLSWVVEIGEEFVVFGLGFGELGFGWMKVVFELWVMFGMMFGSVLVKKLGELVRF